MMTLEMNGMNQIDYHKADVAKQEVRSKDEVIDAYRNERFVVFKEQLAGERPRVTTDEVRVHTVRYTVVTAKQRDTRHCMGIQTI